MKVCPNYLFVFFHRPRPISREERIRIQQEQRDLDVKFFKICMEVMDEETNVFWRNYERELALRQLEQKQATEPLVIPTPKVNPVIQESHISEKIPVHHEPLQKPQNNKENLVPQTKRGKKKRKFQKFNRDSGPKSANVWDYIEDALTKKKTK